MFKSYLNIAARHLTRHKLFSLINIFCLAIGITFSMIIGVFVLDSTGINSDIKNINNQYVVKSKWKQDNMGIDITTLGPLAKTMKDEYPTLVANYYRFDPVTNIISAGDKHFRTQISVGDTTLVSMYGLKLAYGNPAHAFTGNESAVVTADFAVKFFGIADARNKVITVQTPSDGAKHNFVISAVLEQAPMNTVANFTGDPYAVYLPMDANQYFQGGDKGDNWSNVYMASMLELKKGVTADDLKKPFADVLQKYQPPFVKGNLQVQLAPMRNYYIKANDSAVEKTLTTLSLIAAFILLLAIINFVNISVGTSSYRLKEIGLRKVFGGAKRQLIFQYLVESLVLTFTAGFISIGLYEALRPVFGQLLQTSLQHFWQLGLFKIFLLIALMFFIGVISGIYPAFVLSSSNVTRAVAGKTGSAKGGLTLRKVLLVVQFSLAIFVFISALNVQKQVSYFFNKDLGFNKEQVMIVSSLPRQWDSAGIAKMKRIKAQLTMVPGVQSATLSYDIPDGNSAGNLNAYTHNNNDFLSINGIAADADFGKTYGLTLKEGVFLNNLNGVNIRGNVVLNEAAVEAFGWQSPAVGKTFRLGAANGLTLTVVGVVKDFHFESMQKAVQPVIIYDVNESFAGGYRYFSLKLNTSNINGTVAAMENKCRQLFPEAGFEYSFMDEKFQQLYQSEMQLQKAADIATALNLAMVFMGIFGVVAFTLTKRTKEIAVRKVLGANVPGIISIFLKEYAVLIVVSNIIAWPLAYLVSNNWLQNYAYRVQQNVLPYIFVSLFIFITVFVLIIAQCYKAANANPVNSLKYE